MARKKHNIHYIYKTTCNVTGRWYIGMHSTTRLDDGYMGSGKILRYSIRKYGAENHTKEILEYCETREVLVLRETEIVNNELISDGKCMNLKEGGQGGFSSEEHKKKAQKAGCDKFLERLKNDDKFKSEWIIKKSESGRKAMSSGKLNNIQNVFSWTDKTHSDETKQKISEQRKGTGIGKTNSQYGTCWITKDGLNKKIKKDVLDTYLSEGWVQGRK